jgi:Protein of unknown function (DUF3426)
MAREQLEASDGWVRCGHCMEVFDARLGLTEDVALDAAAAHAATADSSSVSPELRFLQQAQKKFFWSKTIVRFFLVIFIASLLFLLGAQLLRTEQARLTRMYPALDPLSQWLCQQVSCVSVPKRRIEQWSIDSSSFEREGAAFRLQFHLKNQALKTLLIPSVELSLLDRNDQVLVRQVMDLQQTSAQDETLGFEKHLSFLITPTTSRKDITGYRLVVFYP